MNAAKAASRMRSRTAVSSPLSWWRFDVDAVAITLSLTMLVPYSTTKCVSVSFAFFASFFARVGNLFSSRASKLACGTQRYQKQDPNFREKSKELKNEN